MADRHDSVPEDERPAAPEPDEETVAGAHVLTEGEVFAGRYQISEEIGRGGFGVVYRAFDRGPLQRTVGLKTIRFPTLSDAAQAALTRRQFLDEARVAGNLSHANIATVFEVAEHASIVYMTQEFAPGRDLRKLMRASGPLPVRRAIAIARQVCDGLGFAHARGIVHRDIKPGNIVVDEEDRVKITDFGIAQSREQDSALTAVAAFTPGYAPPEQLCGNPVDARADVFSVGCLLYEMLAGRPPFEGSTVASVIEKTLHAFPPAPSGIREDLPRALDRIVARALRKNRDERYANVTLLAQDLLNYEQLEYLVDAAAGVSQVVAALESSQLILFLGLHLPAGNEKTPETSDNLIIDHLAGRLESPRGRRSLARLSQDFEIERGRAEMLRQLTAVLRNPRVSPREIIRRVARLPFPVIVTTRYDTFVEEELTRAGRRFRRIIDCRKMPDDGSEEDLIVQLFGTVEDESSIVVTEDDLWDFFGRFHLLSDTLTSLLARRTILFAGYDPEDESFRHLLSEITRFRAGVSGGCYLLVSDVSLATVRWSQSKGLRLIDEEPGLFLLLLEQALTERRRQAPAPAEATPARLPGRPYKFLNYFDTEDESIYFGRRVEVNRLASKIHAYPLNLLYGASGCGKTSLICAGLMPLLRREGDLPVYVRVYDDPVGEIRRAARHATGGGVAVTDDTPLPHLLSKLANATGRRLVIVVDQFEELFVRHDRDSRDAFAATIESALGLARGHVRFVFSLREDFLARLSEFRERIPTIFHNEFRLQRLSADACRAAITEPAALFGLEVESALIDRLLEDLSSEGVDPPQLQIVCDTLYDALLPGDKRITLASYAALGGTRKILTNYLDRVLRESPPTERDAVRQVLKQLVTSEDTKTVSRLSNLARLTASSETEVSRILAELSNRRLVREVHRDEGGDWYELSHEYLVQEIGRWLSEGEKELKRVRELLEQAVRNRRNLGVLMPAPQIQLIRRHEDDLALSKEERQLVRDSEGALRTRRKTIVTATAAVVILLGAVGIVARAGYLMTHRFVESRDAELVEVRQGKKAAQRFEEIRVFGGSPVRWWLDSRLGFPRFLYETDFVLNQLDPARRDALKAGLPFGGGANLDDQLLAMLEPSERVKFFLTSGRTDDAVKLLPALYNDPSVDKFSLDRLTTLAGYAAISDVPVVQAATRHAFRRGSFGLAPWGQNLGPVLASLPDGGWRAVVVPYLGRANARRDALTLIGAFGTARDAALVLPFLEDIEGSDMLGRQVRSHALSTLVKLDDCSVLDRVRRFIVDPEIDSDTRVAGHEYIARCGNHTDLKTLEQAGKALVGVRAALEMEFELESTVRTMYEMFGATAVPSIRGLFAGWPMTRFKLNAMDGVLDPAILPDLRAALEAPQLVIRGVAAGILATRGDSTGLRAAAQVADDRAQSIESRVEALRAFRFVKVPALRAFVASLARPGGETEVRAAALRGLRWYDDDESLSILLNAFNDSDRTVREAALQSFTFVPDGRVDDWLSTRQRDLSVGSRIYATRALQQRRPSQYSAIYVELLRKVDTSVDYPALTLAVVGLRDAYGTEPVTAAIEALSDPQREIRLAATMALVEHPDRTKAVTPLLEAEATTRMPTSVRKAEWAMAVASRAETLGDRARTALTSGDLRSANQILSMMTDSRSGYLAALKFGLTLPRVTGAPNSPLPLDESYMFEEVFEPRVNLTRLLQAELNLRRGSLANALWSVNTYIAQTPEARKLVRDDPRFAQLRSFYDFRVLTGLQPPLTVSVSLRP